MPSRRRALATLATLITLTAATPQPARADNSFVVEPAGTVTFDGRGYGHGIGMSQYGAQGAAIQGLTAAQILAFYYPGTASTAVGNPTVRVWLQGDNDRDTVVMSETGLVARDLGTGASSAVGTWSHARWRVTWTGSAYAISWSNATSGSTWTLWRTSPAGVAFTSSDGTVTTQLPGGVARPVRGSVRGVQDGSTFRTVAAAPMEGYLRGVVPKEMPYSWRPAALQAQAVAARTYAERARRASTARPYDLCDSTTCQVFGGVSAERPETDAAISATYGQVRTYNGAPITAMFCSSNGGWTKAAGAGYPYLPAKRDPYDAVAPGSTSRWLVSRTPAQVQAAWPAIGTFRRIVVTARDGVGDWGGRVTQAQVIGSTATVTVSGDQLRSGLGLRSSWVDSPMVPTTPGRIWPRDYTGDGRADLLLRSGDALVELHAVATSAQTKVTTGSGFAGMTQVVPTGDWDGTGRSDLLAVDGAGDIWAYTGRETGTWQTRTRAGWGWNIYPTLLSPGDWDGDGFADLLAVDGSGRLWFYPRDVVGAIRARVLAVGSGWSTYRKVLGAGDLTGDGRPDLLTVDGAGVLWRHAGTGSPAPAAPVKVGAGWGSYTHLASVGDVTGDGRPDLLALAPDGGLRLFAATSAGTFTYQRVVAWGLAGSTLAR